MWQEVLGVDGIRRNDIFFDLGGHSVWIVRVHTRLSLFQHRTVSALAKSFVDALEHTDRNSCFE